MIYSAPSSTTHLKFPSRSQTLTYKNGFTVPKSGDVAGLTDADIDELANMNPSLTYGQSKPEPPQTFVPAHVAFDKKVTVSFTGYSMSTHKKCNPDH